MGCPPKAQGRSGRAEQIQLQEVPGYSRHEPVEVQAQKFPTSQGRPWVEGGGGVCGWGVAVEVLQASRGQEDRRTGAAGGVRKEKKHAGQSPVAGMERLVSRLVPSGSALLRSAANIRYRMKNGNHPLMLALAMLSIMSASRLCCGSSVAAMARGSLEQAWIKGPASSQTASPNSVAHIFRSSLVGARTSCGVRVLIRLLKSWPQPVAPSQTAVLTKLPRTISGSPEGAPFP